MAPGRPSGPPPGTEAGATALRWSGVAGPHLPIIAGVCRWATHAAENILVIVVTAFTSHFGRWAVSNAKPPSASIGRSRSPRRVSVHGVSRRNSSGITASGIDHVLE